MHLPASANKAPPERTDFPRPGENVTAGDKRGNLARERLRGFTSLRKSYFYFCFSAQNVLRAGFSS